MIIVVITVHLQLFDSVNFSEPCATGRGVVFFMRYILRLIVRRLNMQCYYNMCESFVSSILAHSFFAKRRVEFCFKLQKGVSVNVGPIFK